MHTELLRQEGRSVVKHMVSEEIVVKEGEGGHASAITKVVVQNQTGPKKNRYKPAIEDVK